MCSQRGLNYTFNERKPQIIISFTFDYCLLYPAVSACEFVTGWATNSYKYVCSLSVKLKRRVDLWNCESYSYSILYTIYKASCRHCLCLIILINESTLLHTIYVCSFKLMCWTLNGSTISMETKVSKHVGLNILY